MNRVRVVTYLDSGKVFRKIINIDESCKKIIKFLKIPESCFAWNDSDYESSEKNVKKKGKIQQNKSFPSFIFDFLIL